MAKKKCKALHIFGAGIQYCTRRELVVALRWLADKIESGGVPAILEKGVVVALVDPGAGGPCRPNTVQLEIPANRPNPDAICSEC